MTPTFGSEPKLGPFAGVQGCGVNAAQTGTGGVRSPGLSGATTPAAGSFHAAADQADAGYPPAPRRPLPRGLQVRWCLSCEARGRVFVNGACLVCGSQR